jgi:hypothetical protein
LAACGRSTGASTTSSAAGDGSGPLLLTTSSTTLSGLEAKASGRLVADQSGCVRLKTGAGTLVTPAWPIGYRARSAGDHFVVVDASGSTVAQEGVELQMGGGGVSPAPSGWANTRCAAGSTVWAVGQIGAQ